MTTRRSFRGVLVLVAAVFALIGTACAGGGDAADSANTLGGTDSVGGTDTSDPTGGGGEDICLLHNCESDAECAACSEGRNSCFVEEKRCVECDPTTGSGCPDGEECTEFGRCVPAGQTCDTDAEGNPTIECNDDPDCAACDPQHQVCAAGACVECRGDMEEACAGNEFCGPDNTCIPKCPMDCTSDADCSECGEEGHEAHVCKNHKCAQCKDNSDCPSGEQCTDEGSCVAICGIPGQIPGTCEQDADCAGCEGDNDSCAAPINGGHGTCGPSASGCSDLGDGVVVLPEPFDEVTNACSNDGDCEGVGIQYNVGKLLREITGLESIDDANIDYPMGSCANVTVDVGESSVSCGVCVPCKQDDDCMDIDVDQVADDAFGPLGAIATALLLDQLFGDEDHLIHMFCQPVAGDYGICAPCPTLINDCTGGGGGGSGNCDHDVCEAGGPLDPMCGTCAAAVCAADSYCCNNEWDSICVDAVEEECAGSCTGSGGGCSHDQCETGEALDASCNACVSQICNQDPFCCQTTWDNICVDLVDTVCNGECAGSGCAHSECQQGGPLDPGCSTCATDVCNQDAFCCNTDWDSLCVMHAEDLCGTCTGGGCAHDECQEGGPLDAGCSACAADVCGQDSFCCDNQWDNICVGLAQDSAACSC